MLVVAAVVVGLLTAAPSGALNASAPTPPSPVVGTIKPASGPVAGGTKVVVKGKNLTGAKKVLFGKVKGTRLKVKSATKLTVMAPAQAAGKVHVRVVTQGGKSKATKADFFTYLAPTPPQPPTPPQASPPTITAVTPGSGSTAGGTTVTVSGTNLTGAISVTFGGVAATGLTPVSSTTLHVTSPAHAAGPVDVRVTTTAGTSAVVTAGTFTYVGPRAYKLQLPGDQEEDPGAVLNAVSCPEAQSCVAVGSYLSVGQRVPLAAMRTGPDIWEAFQPDMPNDAAEGADLVDVDCATPTFCVAIGTYVDDSPEALYLPLIETWDGDQWTPSSPALPEDSGFIVDSLLADVDCPAAGTCVAVGHYDENVDGNDVPLVLALAGGVWTTAAVGVPAGSEGVLNAVDCPTVSSCIAVGEEITADSDSEPLVVTGPGTWTVDTTLGFPLDVEVTEPRAILDEVSCRAPGDCVAAGSYFTNDGRTLGLVEVLSAGTWTPKAVAPPALGAPNTPAQNPKVILTSVSCGSTCAAVGQYEVEVDGGPATSTRPLLVTISGTTTPTVQRGAVPDDAEGDPIGSDWMVTCTAGNRCLATGFYEVDPGLSAPLLSALNGGVWSASAAPRPDDLGTTARPLASTLDGSAVVSVGYYLEVDTNVQQALIMVDLPI
jgi:hypothetical protein